MQVLTGHTAFKAAQPWHQLRSLEGKAGHSPGVLGSWPMNLYNLLRKVCLDGWISRNCALCEFSSSKYQPLISLVLTLELPGMIAPCGLMKQEVSRILKVTDKGKAVPAGQEEFEPGLLTAFQKFLLHLVRCVSGNLGQLRISELGWSSLKPT